MKSLYTLGVAAGLVLAAGFSSPLSAAPAAPIAIKQAIGEAPSNVIDVRRGGGMHWRGGGWRGGGRHWGGGGWHGGRHWGGGGWHGGRYGWHGGRRWHGGYWRGGRWYGGGWGWGWGVPLLAAPYAYNYYNDGCGWVTVRRWVNGHPVWVRRYRCW